MDNKSLKKRRSVPQSYSSDAFAGNADYMRWRSDENNHYAFCADAPGKSTYVVDRGYLVTEPAVLERDVMKRIHTVLGLGILLMLALDRLLPVAACLLARAMGVNIGFNYSDNSLYGTPDMVLPLMMTCTLIKYLAPLLIFHLNFRMPMTLGMAMRVQRRSEIPVIFGMVLMVFALCNTWLLFTPSTHLSFTIVGETYYSMDYMPTTYKYIYLAFQLIVYSFFHEILVHGEPLHVLRQFGDWYAISLTALLCACIAHSFTTLLMELTLSMVTGIGALRSGSLLPGALARLLYHALLTVLFMNAPMPASMREEFRFVFMGLILLAGVLLTVVSVRPDRTSPALLTQHHFLSVWERYLLVLRPGALLAALAMGLLMMAEKQWAYG